MGIRSDRTRRSLPRARLWACLALAALLLLPTAAAVQSTVDPHNYVDRTSAVIYTNNNGLPTTGANGIAQTSEGFIWIASYSGLIRYDGNTFERLDSRGGGIASVESLFVDSQDRLWIGTNDNGLALMEGDSFRVWDENDGFSSTKVGMIVEGADGTIYVGTTAGIMMITPDMQAHAVDDPEIANAYIEKLCLGNDGLIYCTTNEDDFFTLRDGKLSNYIHHTETRIEGITCIAADPDSENSLYFGTDDGKLYHGDPNGEISAMECVDISPLSDVYDILKTGDQVWLCTRNGIGVVDSDGFHSMDALPMHNSINRAMMDYEGNLWFTSSREGVMKLVPNRFINILPRFDLSPRVVNSTCLYDGHLFVGTDTGLLVLDQSEPVAELPLVSLTTASGEALAETDLISFLADTRIRSILPDSRGNLWISTWRGCGLVRYDGERATVFSDAEGLLSHQIRAVSEASDGAVYVAHTGGACRIEGDRVTAVWSRDDGIVNPETLSVCVAPNGDVLLGSNGGGIYVINDDGVRCIGKKDGLSSTIVMRIKYDAEERLFWLLTSNSISYMTEDYEITTVDNFPYSNNYDIYKNSEGDYWVLSSNGLYVLPSADLIANGDMKPIHYDLSNGLPFPPTANAYSELTPDGALYISGDKGVARVNIDEPLEDVADLKQAVPFIDVDGKRIYPDETGAFVLSPSAKKLTVYPYVFNYALTDPKVSCQLVGFDPAPVTVSRSELTPLTYTNLRGGDYQFVMILKDAMGRNGKTLEVPIVKVKAPYEEAWFYGLVAVAAMIVLRWLVKAQVQRNTRALEKKHREEAERERIQTELQTASRIQSAVIPHTFPPFPERTEFDLYAVMKPAREVGGDFYDFFMIDDDHLCLVMADVSGKGIPAALFMMVSKSILKTYASLQPSVAEILRQANDMISSNNHVEMFVTVWMGILEISTGRLTAANAGHEYPALKRSGGRFELIRDKHGFVLGGMEGLRYHEYEMQLSPGDKLFVYTDGVPEATDAALQMFGTERMCDALNEDAEASPEQLLDHVDRAVDAFVKDAEQFDDLTMLCLEYRGSAGSGKVDGP